ncbi:hypothetical protein Tco_0216703 [Tanacetum coccineum]
MKVAQVMELVPNQRFLMSNKTRQLGNSKDDDSEYDDSNDVSNDDDDVDSDAGGDNEASDSEKTDSDEDEDLNLLTKYINYATVKNAVMGVAFYSSIAIMKENILDHRRGVCSDAVVGICGRRLVLRGWTAHVMSVYAVSSHCREILDQCWCSSQPKVLDEQEDKTTGTNKGTDTKPGVPDVPKYLFESENESWGDSGDDDGNDDDSDEVTKDNDDDDADSDADGDNEASDSEKTDSDEDENPNLNQNDDEEAKYEEEYVRTLDSFEFTEDDEEYEELYKDVNKTKVPLQKTSTATRSTIPQTIPPITPLTQQSIPAPTPAPTTATTTTLILALPNFSSLFGFKSKRLCTCKRAFSIQNKLTIPRNCFATITLEVTNFQALAIDEEESDYIDLIEKSVKDIIKDEVKSQLPQILPKEVSDYATPMIQSSITESLENIRDREDKDKDGYPPVRSDQWLKKQKTRKDFEPSRGSKSKESKSSLSKGLQAQRCHLNQGDDLGNTNDQPNVEAALKDDWFKKPERPSTPDSYWNTTKTIDFIPPQTWISKIAKAEKPPLTSDELMSTPIDFSTYVMNNLKIENLIQEHLAVTNRLNWTNPEGHEYPFDLSKPLPLIEDQGCQVVPANYFINNDLVYQKGGSSSRKYTTSTTKTKAAKYDTIEGIEDMVPSLWSLVKGYLEDIVFRREDQELYKFREGDFLRLNLRDIKDLLLLLVQ